MRTAVANWTPTKYVQRKGRWRASRESREVNPASRLLADRIAEYYAVEVPRHVRGALLDLGCGKAPLCGLYRDHATEVTRVDWGASHGSEFVDVSHDLNEPLPFADAAYDVVILSDVLEHLQKPVECLKEVRRVLKAGGRAIVNVPFYYWLHEAPHDYYRYTEFGLRHLAEEAGLEVTELRALAGAPAVLLDLLGKMMAPHRLLRPAVRLFPAAYDLMFARRWVKRSVSGKGTLFPLAYGMILTKRDTPAAT